MKKQLLETKSGSVKTRTLDRDFQIKSSDVGADGSFKGYASVFGQLDSYNDIVVPGAFNASLAEYKRLDRKVPILYQHRSGEPIGTFERIEEDGKGLYVEGQLTRGVQRADETYLLMKQGALSGISIGYRMRKSSKDEMTGIRSLIEVDLLESSIVTFPALDSARVDTVKSLSELMTVRDCEDWLRDVAGCSNSEAKSFIARIKAAGTHRDDAEEAAAKRAIDILFS